MTCHCKSITGICAAALLALSGFAADNAKWIVDFRAGENGEVRKQGKIVDKYAAGDIKVEEGLLLLDHMGTRPPHLSNLMIVQEPELLAPGAVLVGEYRGAMVEPGEAPTVPVFNLFLSGSAGGDKPVYGGSTKIAAAGIVTDVGVYAPSGFDPAEMHTLRATLDTATGSYTLAVDGKPALKGKLKPVNIKPQIWFGDGSGKINGRARLEYLRVGKLAD